MKPALLPPVLGLLLTGCALTASKYRIHPDKPSIDLKTDTLYVLSAPPEEIEIGALEQFHDDFGIREGGREQDSLAAYFDERFLQELKTSLRPPRVASVKLARTAETGFPFRIYLDSGGPKQLLLRFWVPNQAVLAAMGIRARYTLSVAALEFHLQSDKGRNGVTVSSGNFQYSPGTSMKPIPVGQGHALTFSFIYLIWDYQANDFVACGSAEGSSSAAFAYTQVNWESILQEATHKMIGRTPLKHHRKSTPRPVGLGN